MQQTISIPFFRPLADRLATNTGLRSIALPLLRACDRPITMTNPFSGLPFHLMSYTHKGYWFYGKSREHETMSRLSALTRTSDTVFEVGGHIGYLSQFFAKRVGYRGQVHVFEPGQQNQHFLRRNIARCTQCIHINAAVTDQVGTATFYEENLGGFMNSLDQGFADGTGNAQNQGRALALRARRVNTTTLDAYATTYNVWPDIVKIDAEGAELAVLNGATKVLQAARGLMVEVARHQDEIFSILTAAGFALHDAHGRTITDAAQMNGNIMATRH